MKRISRKRNRENLITKKIGKMDLTYVNHIQKKVGLSLLNLIIIILIYKMKVLGMWIVKWFVRGFPKINISDIFIFF